MYYKVEMIKNKQFYQKKIKNKITLTIIKKNSDFWQDNTKKKFKKKHIIMHLCNNYFL